MDRLPVLPLGRIVVYPHVVLPMALTDPHAVQLIDEVVQGNKRLLLGVVRPLGGTEPPEGAVMHARAEELYEVGTLGTVVRMLMASSVGVCLCRDGSGSADWRPDFRDRAWHNSFSFVGETRRAGAVSHGRQGTLQLRIRYRG